MRTAIFVALFFGAAALESEMYQEAQAEAKAEEAKAEEAKNEIKPMALAELDSSVESSVELGSQAYMEVQNMKVTQEMRDLAQKGVLKRSTQKTYTVSTEALKAKVAAEEKKVENARLQMIQESSTANLIEKASTMTQAARLQEMAGLIEGGAQKGTEMIKSLSSEAKDALAGVQKMWLDVTAGTLEKFQKIEAALPKGLDTVDPEKEHAHIGAFQPIEEIVEPFMNHLKALQKGFPELNPWTNRVQEFSTFFQKDSLESMYTSNLPGFRKYKKEFVTYKKAHQEHIMNFFEMFEMDDILTVLQSPEF